MGLVTPISFFRVSAVALDPDAQAFLTATGITDSTITTAINNLVLELKAESLWSKMQAVYPFVGGTATTHKYNLKDPQDTNGAYRLVFLGTWTHDSNGIKGNGTDTQATTFISVENLGAGTDDAHFTLYARDIPTARNGTDLGANNGTSYLFLNHKNASNLAVFTLNTGAAANTQSFTGTTGFFGVSRLSSATQVLTIDTTQYSVARTSTSTAGNTRFIVIGAYNNNGVGANYQDRQYSFSTFGDGLTDSEMDTLTGINETFQTTLGRFV